MPKPSIDFKAATEFIWTTARLIDRLQFAHMFLDAPREPVLAALRAYQNPDGGFGNGLEPDIRALTSQTIPTWTALVHLDEIGAFDDPMVTQALDYLQTVTSPDGGVPFALASIRDYPRAPWWQADDNPPPSLNPTAFVAALLYKNGVDHPWLAPAAAYSWREIEALQSTTPYQARAILPFLTYAPERDRAEAAFERLRKMIFDEDLVALDPDAEGDAHFPLDYAPRPGSIARRMFTDEVIERHLDALAAAQQPDGGWNVNWLIWAPAVGQEWRGVATVRALLTLRAYGRA